MANLSADEEAQINRALHPQGQEDEQRAPKPAWLDQNGQYTPALVAMAAGFLYQLPSGEDFIHEHNVHFTGPLALILFFLFLFAGILWVYKCEISGKGKVKYPQKMVIMSLNLLILAALMSGNVISLAMVDKSYLPISVSIAVLGFIPLVILFYSKVELDQEYEPQGQPNEAVENMVKSCYKITNFTATIGFSVQTAVVIYCLKNQVPPKDHPQYSLIVAYITSMLGSISSTITTSPLQFQSDLMHCILKQLPIIMLLFQGLVAVFVASKILNPTMEVFAVCIPSIVMFLVTLCPKSHIRCPLSSHGGHNKLDENGLHSPPQMCIHRTCKQYLADGAHTGWSCTASDGVLKGCYFNWNGNSSHTYRGTWTSVSSFPSLKMWKQLRKLDVGSMHA